MALRKDKPIPAVNVSQIKRRIVSTPGVHADLNQIVKAGADRDALVDLIARAVIGRLEKPAAEQMRSRQQELRSVAVQLRSVARHAERLAKDNSTYLDLQSPFADNNFKRFKGEETKRRASVGPFQAMRDYADWAEKQATVFGRCLRRNAQKEHSLGIFFLLCQVHLRWGKLFEAPLAELLTVASEAAGEGTEYSASRLRKMFQRHVCPSPQRLDKPTH